MAFVTKRTGWALLGLSVVLIVGVLVLRRHGQLPKNVLFGVSAVAAVIAVAGRVIVRSGAR